MAPIRKSAAWKATIKFANGKVRYGDISCGYSREQFDQLDEAIIRIEPPERDYDGKQVTLFKKKKTEDVIRELYGDFPTQDQLNEFRKKYPHRMDDIKHLIGSDRPFIAEKLQLEGKTEKELRHMLVVYQFDKKKQDIIHDHLTKIRLEKQNEN